MKRILNVSYFSSLRLKNCYINDVNRKVSNGFIRNGYEVIDYSDRDLCRFFGFGRKNFIGLKRLQKHFINFCIKCKPDAIVMCHVDTISPETLLEVRKHLPNIKIMQYNIDAICPSLPNGLFNAEKIKTKLDVVDATIITTADKDLLKQFEKDGKYLGFMPNIVDKSLEIANMFEVKKPQHDIIFGGTDGTRKFCGKKIPYMSIIDIIKDNLPNAKLNIFGLGKKNKIEGPEYQNAFSNAAIGLNLSSINDNYLYSSDRMAHIMGNGLLCMLEESTGFKDIFNDDEIAFYKTPEEFISKLKYYTENPEERMRVAKNGHDKYIKYFNEITVTKYMADILFGTVDDNDYIWTKLLNKNKEN